MLFEIALRDMIGRIKDGPAPSRLVPSFAPMFFPPGKAVDPRSFGAPWPIRIPRSHDR